MSETFTCYQAFMENSSQRQWEIYQEQRARIEELERELNEECSICGTSLREMLTEHTCMACSLEEREDAARVLHQAIQLFTQRNFATQKWPWL
jgi:hypothetical protein